ncbi:RNA polymerase sigma factor YlaC [compost metagenome]
MREQTMELSGIDYTFIEQYGKEVRNYAFYLTRKNEVADDIAQEVWIKACRNRASFRGDCSEKTWLHTITRHTVCDYKRSAYARRVTPIEHVELPNVQASAEEEYLEKELKEDLFRIVQSLPVQLRIVLMLKAKFGMKPVEIAETLNLSLNTVKSRLHRARQKAKEQWVGIR